MCYIRSVLFASCYDYLLQQLDADIVPCLNSFPGDILCANKRQNSVTLYNIQSPNYHPYLDAFISN